MNQINSSTVTWHEHASLFTRSFNVLATAHRIIQLYHQPSPPTPPTLMQTPFQTGPETVPLLQRMSLSEVKAQFEMKL